MALGAITITHTGAHEDSLEGLHEAERQLPAIHGLQDRWTDDLPEMTLEAKTKRLKAIEMFQTSNKKIICDPAPTRWSEITAALATVKHIVLPPDLDDLACLSHAPPTPHVGVNRLVKATCSLIECFDQGVIEVWVEASPLDQLVVIALETLQEDYLSRSERLWGLKVLRCIQAYLPRGDLEPIRSNPSTGPVSRGALELFLTEGLDLTTMKKLANDNISEVLERVEIIVNIRNYFENFGKANLNANFIEIFDSLLQRKGAAGRETLQWIALRCMQHMVTLGNSPKETDCVFHILEHISTYNTACRERIQDHVTRNDHFGKIYQAISDRFKYQSAVRPSIQEYFSREDVDNYVGNLLLPFIGLSLVQREHIEHIITSFKAQDSALKDGTAELYGLDPDKAQKYREDQEFVIGILYKASPYIEGSRELLDGEIHVPRGNLHYRPDLNHISNSENRSAVLCPICLDGFFEGQRVIKLKCSKPHKFHEQCMN
ncbi:uncharacterized protein MELLADRAFT_88170 [Melampsora larici-populina 98AG31]|uniref:Uncharacterized protein n=1 Tax=Melampsora larici-populina (strain 98AG31 / pathotype 3-4-7) TaxID=747676 RepID=F4RQU5_MELLP|nr:uncharacterized protein MELLADRAFT_88170 [Melampsora larici-populina 98AG31]EGG05101.1 hypothetical protein MELLADRAFT_88170 [Melampsora larici-populina 98AG31]